MLLNALVTLLLLVTTSILLPQLPLYILRFVLSRVGWLVQKRTRCRRAYIISQVRADEEASLEKCPKSAPQTQTVEEDWEKVDGSSSDFETAGSNKPAGNEDWEGIVGFFHPFWYEFYPMSL